MVKRAFKHFVFKVMKWMFCFSFIYIAFILWIRNSQEKVSEKELSTDMSMINENENPSTAKPQSKLMEDLSKDLSSKISESHEPPKSLLVVTDPPIDKHPESLNTICPGITFPSLPADDTWQPVKKSESVYVLSAYYIKDKSSVFVIGVRPDVQTVSVICQLWRGEKAELIEENEAKETSFFEERGYEYTSTVLRCPVGSSTQPTHVSLVEKKCDSPTNLLQIRSATPELPYKRRLTVCLSPLIMNFDATFRFVKWVEINKLLGVEKFVVYNYSSSANMARLLTHYTSKGLIEVVQWKPPFVVNGLAHNEIPVQLEKYGDEVALNDCLFRNKQYSEYISNMDINEFMIPRAKDTSLIDMVNGLRGNVAAYYINMAFIQKINTVPESPTASQKQNAALKSPETKTTVHIGFMGNRISKVILRTSDVDFTLPRKVPGVETYIVPPEQSVLHIHPGIGQNQALGTLIDDVLPKNMIDMVQREVQNVKTSLPNVPIH